PFHVDQHRLQIEILARRLALQPALSPCAEYAHQHRQLLPRFGQLILGAVRTVRPGNRADEGESLEPFGKNGAGHPGNAPADVVEAAAAAQDFPYDQEGPTAAQHFVGARYGAELPVSRHARQPITARRPARYGFRTTGYGVRTSMI